MAKNLKRLLFTILLFYCLIVSLSSVQASEEFTTSYDVIYRINSSGLTTVNQKISLINKFSNIYATEYTLSVGSLNIQNVRAWDSLGPLGTSISRSHDSTIINLVFNEKVVGKDKTLNFTLEYESLDFASKKGQVWEIIIPKVANIEEIEEYNLTLNVPLILGEAAYLSPKPISSQPPSYFFNKTAGAKGIMAAFGECQIFDFKISYYLKNPDMNFKIMQIALPPDTAYQKIIYQKIEPKPEEIIVDDDGNWLASYKLGPKGELKIVTLGSAQIFLKPITGYGLLITDYKDYLGPQKYWEVDDPEIKNLAKKLKTSRKIYDFVVKTLSYDYQRIGEAERLGAVKTLANSHSALCMEFTDLFIALCRAAGIPAREINGFAYTENPRLKPLSLREDILHAWPEYWDEKRKIWIPVDPTWEETTGGVDFFNKLDLNHFAFVIHGMKSNFPQAPGEGPQKNVEVTFAKTLAKIKEELKVDFDLPKKAVAGFSISGKVVIKNTGNVAFHNLDLVINSNRYPIDSLPSFASRSFPITLAKIHWWQSKVEKITIDVNQYHLEQEISIQPFLFQIGFFLTKLFLRVKNLF